MLYNLTLVFMWSTESITDCVKICVQNYHRDTWKEFISFARLQAHWWQVIMIKVISLGNVLHTLPLPNPVTHRSMPPAPLPLLVSCMFILLFTNGRGNGSSPALGRQSCLCSLKGSAGEPILLCQGRGTLSPGSECDPSNLSVWPLGLYPDHSSHWPCTAPSLSAFALLEHVLGLW